MITIFVLLSFVTYRVTRFLVRDTLIDKQRFKLHAALLSKSKPWRNKLFELIDCPYCLSVWVAGASVLIANQFTAIRLPWMMWLAVAGGCLTVWQHTDD